MHIETTTGTTAERKVYDFLVKVDLWCTLEDIAHQTSLSRRVVEDALYLLCDEANTVVESENTYRAV